MLLGNAIIIIYNTDKNQQVSDFPFFQQEWTMNAMKSESFIDRLARFIVDKRNLIFLLYVFAFIFCIFSRGWVKVENDVTVYLPEDTETP